LKAAQADPTAQFAQGEDFAEWLLELVPVNAAGVAENKVAMLGVSTSMTQPPAQDHVPRYVEPITCG
jgi:hypothetical protein